MSDGEKKKWRRTRGTFQKFHVEVVQNNGKEMYKKKCVALAKVARLLIRPIVVFFYRSRYVYIPSQDSGQDFEPGLDAKLDNFSLLTIKRRDFVAIMESCVDFFC